MKHQLSTIAVLALIAVPVSACGSTTDRASENPDTAANQSPTRLYESDVVSQALLDKGIRVYESDVVSGARPATR